MSTNKPVTLEAVLTDLKEQLSVAWQIRCPFSADPEWKTITQKQYESTLFTGHAYGISHMTKDFELRPLFIHPAAQELVPLMREFKDEEVDKAVEAWFDSSLSKSDAHKFRERMRYALNAAMSATGNT